MAASEGWIRSGGVKLGQLYLCLAATRTRAAEEREVYTARSVELNGMEWKREERSRLSCTGVSPVV